MICLVVIALTGCSSNPGVLTEYGKKVEIVLPAKVSNCDIIGKVIGENKDGSLEMAKIDLRNRASRMSSDSVVVKEVVQNGSHFLINALAYKCN